MHDAKKVVRQGEEAPTPRETNAPQQPSLPRSTSAAPSGAPGPGPRSGSLLTGVHARNPAAGLSGNWSAAVAFQEGGGDTEIDEENDVEAALKAAHNAMLLKRYQKAYNHFSTVVELGSPAQRLQGALGRCAAAIKLGRWQQAAAEARLAQQLAPYDARGAVAETLAFMAGRQLGPAVRCLKRAHEVDPIYPGVQRLAAVVGSVCRRARLEGPQEQNASRIPGGLTELQGPPAVDRACLSTVHPIPGGPLEAMPGQQSLVPDSEPAQAGPKFKRLITPPQSDSCKRALLWSRCNSTDQGTATEGPREGLDSPSHLAAIGSEVAEPTLPLPGAAAPSLGSQDCLGVQGALEVMHIDSDSVEHAAKQERSPVAED